MSINPFDQQKPLKGIKRIFVVGSGKGGVGKSTVSANLALTLKDRGWKVGLLDADIYGPSIPRLFGALHQAPLIGEDQKIEPIVRHGLKLMSIGFLVDESQAMVWRGPMLFKAIDQFFKDVRWGELDALVIDLPPGTGDVGLTIAQKVPVTGAIVITTPQNMSLADAKKAIDMFERVNIPLMGVVENMAYFKASPNSEAQNLFPPGELNAYLDAKGLVKLARLPFEPTIGLASEAGLPMMLNPSPDSEACLEFQQLAEQVINFNPKVNDTPSTTRTSL